MHFVYRNLKRHVPELNTRVFDETDFHRLCQREHIVFSLVTGFPHWFRSCYVHDGGGQAYILINRKLPFRRQLFLGLYELAHHFLHSPPHEKMYKRWLRSHKDVFEAESLPLLAMLPVNSLQTELEEYKYGGKFARRIAAKREYLWHNWRI